MSTIESAEKVNDWKLLKAEAPLKAQGKILEIPGFGAMSDGEKAAELSKLIEQLANEGNHNRFVAHEVAREQAIFEEKARHEAMMQKLVA